MDNDYLYKLKVSPTHDNKVIVLEDFITPYITVPANFKSNGADIPVIFWSLIPPFKPKYLPAVIVHDYLISIGEFKFADITFKRMLREIEISINTYAMYTSVSLYTKYIR